MKTPQIKTVLPGPKAARLIQMDAKFVSPSYTRCYPLVAETGKGAWIRDVDGNCFLDFTAGIAVTASGHCHPKVLQAIRYQSERLLHMSGTDFYYPAEILLAEKLSEISPGDGVKRVYFGNSGAEAVEAAFKLARWHSRRELNLAFYGAFHGRTMGALSLTASKTIQRRHYNPLVPGITHIPYPYCYRCPYQLCYPECGLACVRWVENTLFRTTIPPEEVAAVFVEPIQGEGGYVVPPPEFHREMYALCEKFGILYVADEVQSGMGRTGKMFAMEHFGVVPEIITVAKGIASGLPLGAMIAKTEIMNWEAGSHASTFGGNPVSCAAAMVTIKLLQDSLMKNAQHQGTRLMDGLHRLQDTFECIGDVRGKGLMVAVEFVKDREKKTPNAKVRDSVVQAAFQKGLLLLGCGENNIRFSPPLIVDDDEVDVCLNLFEDALKTID